MVNKMIKAVKNYEIWCISGISVSKWPAYVHESVQWWWDEMKLFLYEAFWSNIKMLSNPFALDDSSFLRKGQLVFPSNGCLREDFYNMHWFYYITECFWELKSCCKNLQSWSTDWPVNVMRSNLGEIGLSRPIVCSVFCFQDAVLFAAVVPALCRALKHCLATLWCTLWWSWP